MATLTCAPSVHARSMGHRFTPDRRVHTEVLSLLPGSSALSVLSRRGRITKGTSDGVVPKPSMGTTCSCDSIDRRTWISFCTSRAATLRSSAESSSLLGILTTMGSSSAAHRRWHENTSQNMPFATREPKAMSAHATGRGSSMPKGGNEVRVPTRPTWCLRAARVAPLRY